MELAIPAAEFPAAVVAAVVAAAAEVSDPSELVWDSLMILTEVPLFMHISASGSGAEAEKVMSAHFEFVSYGLMIWGREEDRDEG